MKIGGKPPVGAENVYQKQQQNNELQKTKAQKEGAANNKDSVELSGKAQQIKELAGKVGELPETRADKVNQIKAQIKTGDYNVSGKEVAAKMLSES